GGRGEDDAAIARHRSECRGDHRQPAGAIGADPGDRAGAGTFAHPAAWPLAARWRRHAAGAAGAPVATRGAAVRWWPLLPLLLASCGGSTPPPPPPAGDPALQRSERTARLAFSQRQLEEAARFYRDALDKAYARDDIAAISDNGFSLAV